VKKPVSVYVHIILFTFIRLVSSTAYRMVYPFLPAFRDGLGVPVDVLTRMIGYRSLVAAAVGPFFASLGDTRGRKIGMLAGMSVFVTGTAVVVLWPTFAGFAIATMLTTLGKNIFDPTMQAYIGDRVPYERRSFALTITELSWSGAYIVGIPLVGWVIGANGWLAPFPLLAGLMIAAGVIFYLSVPKDPPRASKGQNMAANLRLIAKSPAAVAAMGLTIFTCIANEFVNLVFGVWMEDSFGLQLAALGAAAAVLGAAEVSGEGLVAAVTDRLGKRRAIFIGLVVNCIAVLLLPSTAGSLTAALVCLFFFYISFEFFIVSLLPLLSEVMPAARATMMAGFFTCASIGRFVSAQFATPLYDNGFWSVVIAAVAFNLLGLACVRALRLPGEK
jgi:predicted MFS family arabinose efflux permease